MTWSVERHRPGGASTGMRVALGQGSTPSDEYLAFARQLGLSGVQFNTPLIPGDRRWELRDLVALREPSEIRRDLRLPSGSTPRGRQGFIRTGRSLSPRFGTR